MRAFLTHICYSILLPFLYNTERISSWSDLFAEHLFSNVKRDMYARGWTNRALKQDGKNAACEPKEMECHKPSLNDGYQRTRRKAPSKIIPLQSRTRSRRDSLDNVAGRTRSSHPTLSPRVLEARPAGA